MRFTTVSSLFVGMLMMFAVIVGCDDKSSGNRERLLPTVSAAPCGADHHAQDHEWIGEQTGPADR